MSDLSTSIAELVLTDTVPDRDAGYALSWFKGESGRDTLLKMGNAPNDINEPSYDDELATLEEFLVLDDEGKQKTWMLRYGEVTIGAAWIELIKNHDVEAPSVHLMIGDPAFRGKGIGKAVMSSMIRYLKEDGSGVVYSRHLTSNEAVIALNRSLGFVPDGHVYTDKDGLEWQNIKLLLKS